MADLPMYPQYKKIDFNDVELLKGYILPYPSYSDFNILSLFSWDVSHTNEFSILNGNLVIKIKDYLSEGYRHSLLGINDIDNSLNRLIIDHGSLSFVPDITYKNIKEPGKFKIEEDRDNFDYIISCEAITKLEGRKFKHLREDVHKFQKIYKNYELRPLDLSNSIIFEEFSFLNSKWYHEKDFDTQKQEEENIILDNFLKYSQEFRTVFLGFYLENDLIGYILNEVISDTIVMSHFGVSNKDIQLSAYMLEYEVMKYLYEHGYKYQNQQQDAGLPGLRTAKMFYNPEYFLKKYNITLK